MGTMARGVAMVRAFVAVGALAAGSVASAQGPNPAGPPRYQVIEITSAVDIAPFSARAWAVSNGVNATATGTPFVGGEFGLGSSVPSRPFVWDARDQAVDVLPGMPGRGVVRGLTARGASVGSIVRPASTPGGGESAFLAWPEARGAMLLPGLSGRSSAAYGVNESFVVVGASADRAGDERATAWVVLNASGAVRPIDLGTLGGASSRALAVNGHNVGVGGAANAAGVERAFMSAPIGHPASTPRLRDLGGLLNSGWSVARDVNDRNLAVGQAQAGPAANAGVRSRAVLFNAATNAPTPGAARVVNLGALRATDRDSDALAINGGGTIVGWSGDASNTQPWGQRAFVVAGGQMYDLNQCIPAGSGWHLAVASDVNDRGQIVGWGYRVSNATPGAPVVKAFLLTPARE